jgi:hypothetical protein
LRTAAVHCRVGGKVAVLPDFVRETFEHDRRVEGLFGRWPNLGVSVRRTNASPP